MVEYMRSNITLMKWMIAEGYQDARTLKRRINAMEDWIANGTLLKPDDDAQYAAVIEIDLAEVTEPILACPNDPDDVKLLSEVAGAKIDEVFIGSCMTNIGHFRAAAKVLEGRSDIPTRLWIAPPTKMDALILTEEGYYGILGKSGARMEMPGCSLCMGNQAQIRKGSTAISTSTRNFPNRLGIDTQVYLGSAELAAMCALAGRIVTVAEYMEQIKLVNAKAAEVYRYMNFDQIPAFVEAGGNGRDVSSQKSTLFRRQPQPAPVGNGGAFLCATRFRARRLQRHPGRKLPTGPCAIFPARRCRRRSRRPAGFASDLAPSG